MKAIAATLVLSLLSGSTWAETPKPVKPTVNEMQVPCSFLPPKDSIFRGETLKPTQDLSEVQVLGNSVVPTSTTPQMPPPPNMVYGINPKQAKGLAGEIARFLASQHPVASTTIQLPRPKNQKLQAFDTVLETALREQGFALSCVTLPGAVSLSYQVIRVKHEILVRLVMDQSEISRLYRDDLVALTPFTRLNQGGQP